MQLKSARLTLKVLLRANFWADFITTMVGFKFSLHTGFEGAR